MFINYLRSFESWIMERLNKNNLEDEQVFVRSILSCHGENAARYHIISDITVYHLFCLRQPK